MKIVMLFFILISQISYGSEEQLIPFETDYCTGYAEGTRELPNLWKHCCVEHDLYFWAGGSQADRNQTDSRLKSCIEKTGATFQANLMYLGVRIGGMSPIKFKGKQWGNAWGDHRAHYQKLRLEEIYQIFHELELSTIELPVNVKTNFKQQLLGRLDSE